MDDQKLAGVEDGTRREGEVDCAGETPPGEISRLRPTVEEFHELLVAAVPQPVGVGVGHRVVLKLVDDHVGPARKHPRPGVRSPRSAGEGRLCARREVGEVVGVGRIGVNALEVEPPPSASRGQGKPSR